MPRRSLCVLLLSLLPLVTASAQVTGEIGVTSFNTAQAAVLDLTGAQVNFTTPGFGGGTSQSILWDPSSPSDFYVGGFGFVGRLTVTGPGTSTYTLITTGVNTAAQMSFDAGGQIIVADAGIDQLVSVDPASGTVTPITSGTQPWGTSLNAATFDPITGDILAGSSGAIHRVTGGVATTIVTGFTGFVSGLAIDPLSSDAMATILTSNRLLRIDAANTVTDEIPAGTLSAMNSISVDENGDFVVNSSTNVYRVPNGGGTPTLVGSVTGLGTSISGVSVVGGLGATATFATRVTFDAAADASLRILALPAGTSDGWTFITTTTPTPVGGGPVFGITPDAVTFALLTLFPAPQVGNPVHWIAGVPGFYPDVPFVLPAASYASFSGQTWDVISLAFSGGGAFLGASSVGRVTWP